MKKSLRRKIFYLLIAVFVIIAPLFIAYALGYTFDLSKRSVEKIGGIFIKSKTSSLSIFLNNSFEKETSFFSGGALLPDIQPGTYLVRVEKAGFQSWSKVITVSPGVVTEMRNILMVPNPVIAVTSTKNEISDIASYSNPSSIYHLDKKGNLLETSSVSSKIVAKNVKYFADNAGLIYFVDGNGFLARLDPVKNNIDTLGRPGFFMGDKAFEFVFSPVGDLLVVDSAGGGYLLDSKSVLTVLGGGIINAYFDRDGAKLLLYKEHEVEVLWMIDNIQQPFQARGTKETILKVDSSVLDARWYFEDSAHIFVRTQEGIFVTELDGRNGRNTLEVVSGKTAGEAALPDYPTTLFFTKDKNNLKIEL